MKTIKKKRIKVITILKNSLFYYLVLALTAWWCSDNNKNIITNRSSKGENTDVYTDQTIDEEANDENKLDQSNAEQIYRLQKYNLTIPEFPSIDRTIDGRTTDEGNHPLDKLSPEKSHRLNIKALLEHGNDRIENKRRLGLVENLHTKSSGLSVYPGLNRSSKNIKSNTAPHKENENILDNVHASIQTDSNCSKVEEPENRNLIRSSVDVSKPNHLFRINKKKKNKKIGDTNHLNPSKEVENKLEGFKENIRELISKIEKSIEDKKTIKNKSILEKIKTRCQSLLHDTTTDEINIEANKALFKELQGLYLHFSSPNNMNINKQTLLSTSVQD